MARPAGPSSAQQQRPRPAPRGPGGTAHLPPRPSPDPAIRYLTISGLDRVTDPAKATRLRGRIHAAARAAAERRPTTCNATGTAITIGISGTDAQQRIDQLRGALAKLTTKHGWTIREEPR